MAGRWYRRPMWHVGMAKDGFLERNSPWSPPQSYSMMPRSEPPVTNACKMTLHALNNHPEGSRRKDGVQFFERGVSMMPSLH